MIPRRVAGMVLPMQGKLPIAVLVSGTGTNLGALLDTVHSREAEIVAVASSVAGVAALERARERGVPTAVFARAEYEDRRARDEAMASWLEERGVGLVGIRAREGGNVAEELGHLVGDVSQ